MVLQTKTQNSVQRKSKVAEVAKLKFATASKVKPNPDSDTKGCGGRGGREEGGGGDRDTVSLATTLTMHLSVQSGVTINTFQVEPIADWLSAQVASISAFFATSQFRRVRNLRLSVSPISESGGRYQIF